MGVTMITIEQAKSAKVGDVWYHVTRNNRDGTPLRARVNGKCKVWVTKPLSFQLPMKHGLKDCFYITESNMAQWSTTLAGSVVERVA